jgi:NADPH-dependent curcumin reductase CurA
MAGSVNRQIVLTELPRGKLLVENFKMRETQIPKARDGEVLLHVRLVSLDAANRAWMQGETYRAALNAGSVMDGYGIAEVIESNADGFARGDLVLTTTGWQDYVALPVGNVVKIERVEPLSHLLSVYGIAGRTAYHGLLSIGQPREGETVVVSAAAGSVGSFVGQIAKLKGCRAIGIAGSPEKCNWLVNELGFDDAINYKEGDLSRALKTSSPQGIDIYFDNVGGQILETCLEQMKLHGRIICCGAVSSYDGDLPDRGPRGVPRQIVIKRLMLKGFIMSDFNAERDRAIADLRAWVQAGRVKIIEDISDGLETLPSALVGLLAGENRGKRMVRVS